MLKGSGNRVWYEKSRDFKFFDLKVIIESLNIQLTPDHECKEKPDFLLYGLVYNEGYIGKVKNNISENTYYAEISVRFMLNKLIESSRYYTISYVYIFTKF